ncbi:MAG: type methionyl aminopeptidase, partial [Armatimonadetes bacterium]|nr:type methionyl aminopeptidase [Armatimonadota bacterium]
MRITYKNARDLEKMREAGFIVSTVLATLRDAVAPGISTLELDALAYDVITKHGGTPSFLNHRAGDEVYHHSTCISINEEVVHGIPRADRKLREGDLVSLDVGVKFKGFHGDSAITVPVGKVSEEAQRLLAVTEESLFVGLRAIRPKGRLQDIGRAVQEYVEGHGFSVVRELSGHGIGRSLWEP